MSAPVPADALNQAFARILGAAQRRAAMIVLLRGLPLMIGGAVLGNALAGHGVALLVIVIVLSIVAVVARTHGQVYNQSWLLRRLDERFPAFEDSSTLVMGATVSPLQTLQRARIEARMAAEFSQAGATDFRPPYPRHALRLSLLAGAGLITLAAALPTLQGWIAHPASTRVLAVPDTGAIQLVETALRIAPPAYTGLSTQTFTTLDAKLPIDSGLEWRLQFDRDPRAAAIVFQDGSRLPLQHEGPVWLASTLLAASALYRIERDGQAAAPAERWNRLDALPDQPPEIIVQTPDKTLTVLTQAQTTWDFAFEARDDYGLGTAEMTVTLAQGTGEQVKVSEQTIVLDGGSDRHQRRYRKRLDLGALGYSQGDDLIVKLAVTDNHPGTPNRGSSASYILRWPAAKSVEGAGVEGLVQKTLPAYFRSERQIIIDTEALQAQRGSLADDKFAKQADELGIDQKVLRLRYGQFLGEGFESLAEHALADPDRAKPSGSETATDDTAPLQSLKQVPAEAEARATARNGLGQSEDVLHEFGHTHDNGEATTLLDPETRRILKAALDEMWQAELHLRQARPDLALPYEYKALAYIKQVQQAERIYLERAGLDLPQVDSSRRLSGERAGLEDRRQTLAVATGDDAPATAIWRALEQGRRPDWSALSGWLRDHPDAVADPLGLVAAADGLQRDPSCASCRADLKARLWPLLPASATGVNARRLPDPAGAAYLEALRRGISP